MPYFWAILYSYIFRILGRPALALGRRLPPARLSTELDVVVLLDADVTMLS